MLILLKYIRAEKEEADWPMVAACSSSLRDDSDVLCGWAPKFDKVCFTIAEALRQFLR